MKNTAALLLVVVSAGACGAGPGPGVDIDGRVVVDPIELAVAFDSEIACLPGGSAVMGNGGVRPGEGPARDVTLDAFCILKYEVTNAQYSRFTAESGDRVPPHWDGPDPPEATAAFPVVGVDWGEAAAFCEWMGGRLPTEAEWERACRGDTGRSYPWGDIWVPGAANVAGIELLDFDELWRGAAGAELTGGAVLEPVGSHPGGTTPEGIHDLCGNAAEWVADWYDRDAYLSLPAVNPLSPGPPWSHAIRGGAWAIPVGGPGLAPRMASCTNRDASHADQSARIGFRCAFETTS